MLTILYPLSIIFVILFPKSIISQDWFICIQSIHALSVKQLDISLPQNLFCSGNLVKKYTLKTLML